MTLAALLALLGWHVVAVVRFLAPALIDGHPIVQRDYAFHQAGAYLSRSAWVETGGLRAYDALQGAGMPHGGIPGASNRLALLLVPLLPGEVPRAFAGVLCATFVGFPLLFLGAARVGGARVGALLVATLLAVAAFWSFDDGKLRFLYWGMYAQMASLALLPLLFALLWRGRTLGAGVVALGGFAVHTTFLVPAALALAVAFGLGAHRRSAVLVAAVLLGVVLALGGAVGVFGGGANVIEPGVFFRWPPAEALAITLAVPAAPWILLGGLLLAAALGREGGAWLLLATLMGLVSLGADVPGLASLQPGRFLPAPVLLLVVPLARAIERAPGWAGPAGLLLVGVLGVRALPAPPPRPILAWDGRTLEAFTPLFEALRGRPGRLLLEDTEHGVEPNLFNGTLLAALLPRLLDRPVLCPPYSDYRLRHREVRLLSGTLGGEDVEALAPAEVRAWLDRYAVGDVVAWHPATLRALEATPGLRLAGVVRDLYHFEVEEVAPYATTANVRLVELGIEVRDATTPRTVIAAHFDPHLATDPPLRVVREDIPGDPIGLVAVENGDVRSFTVSWAGRLPRP